MNKITEFIFLKQKSKINVNKLIKNEFRRKLK